MQLYTFYYTDGSYLSHELTEEQYDDLTAAIVTNASAIRIHGVGVFRLHEIRSVVINEISDEEPESAEPDLTPEQQDWIRVMQQAEEVADDDTDYAGGGFI